MAPNVALTRIILMLSVAFNVRHFSGKVSIALDSITYLDNNIICLLLIFSVCTCWSLFELLFKFGPSRSRVTDSKTADMLTS